MDETLKPLRIPPQISVYADKHNVSHLVESMVTSLLMEQPDDPISYLITFLQRLSLDSPRVLLLGPPAVGKHMLAKTLSNELRAIHLTAESLLKGLSEEEYSAEVLVQQLQQRLKETDCFHKGWVLVGIPQTRVQVLQLQRAGIIPEHVVMLEAPEEVLLQRNHGRFTDPVTGDVYHQLFVQPENDTIKRRLEKGRSLSDQQLLAKVQHYRCEVTAVKAAYQHVLKVFNADQPPADVFQQALTFVTTRRHFRTPRIVLVGPSGSGKSHLARLVSEKYKVVDGTSMTSSAEQQLCLNICSVPSSSSSSLSCSRKWAKHKKWTSKKQKPEKKKKSFISPEEEEDDEEAPLQAPPPELTHGPPQKKRRRKEEVKEGGSGSIKTSSLFRHNPEIPEILRPAVAQLKEKVFTSASFSDLHLHPHLVATLNKVLNVSRLTSIQQQTIPALLSGRDAAVRSQTGSGKTLSYAVPLVQRLQASEPKVSRSDGPLALVVVPTRELALQTYNTFQKLLKPFTWIVPGVLMGGEKKKAEKARIRKGMNVVVSTPGRLADHIQNTLSLALSAVRWLVLDEADRILDLGFDRELTVILNGLNRTGPTRQNVLLSATLSPGVTRLADVCLHDPISISVSGPAPSDPPSQSESFAVPEELQQFVVLVPSKVRLVCLAAFILDQCKFSHSNKIIVFVSSCEAVEFLHLLFGSVLTRHAANQELSFLRLHGNMRQEERSQVFHQFSASATGVLLCTDVAARGLDLPQVTWIVQYTPPSSTAEYVHRVGRTARIGGSGNSLLFLTPAEATFITELANHNISVSEMKLQDVLSCLMKDDAFKGRGKYHSQTSPQALQQDIRERATVLQTQLEDFVHSDARWVQAAKKALQSFLRAYTTYPAHLKQVFHLRRLHLGHTAKSFGLRDAPQGLSPGPAPRGHGGPWDRVRSRNQNQAGKRAGNLRKNQNQNPGRKRLHPGHREAVLIRSEFSSGLEGGGAKKRRKRGITEEED